MSTYEYTNSFRPIMFKLINKSQTCNYFDSNWTPVYQWFTINLSYICTNIRNTMYLHIIEHEIVSHVEIANIYHLFTTNLPLIGVNLLQNHAFANNCQNMNIPTVFAQLCSNWKTNQWPATNLTLIEHQFANDLRLTDHNLYQHMEIQCICI